MVGFTGAYWGLGTGVGPDGTFYECGGYTRPSLSLSGSPLGAMTQSLSTIASTTASADPSPSPTIKYGAVFDSATTGAGNCLAWWAWDSSKFTAVGSTFPAITVNFLLNTYMTAALNLSVLGGSSSSGATIDRGAQIGTINGQPVIAGVKLISGGYVLAMKGGMLLNAGTGSGFVFNIGGVNVGSFDSTGSLWMTGDGNFSGDLTTLGGIRATDNIVSTTGTVAGAAFSTTGNMDAQGDISTSAGNISASAGTVTAASIAATGTLSGNSLSISGTAGNLTLTTNRNTILDLGGIDMLIKVGGTAVASIGTAGNLVIKGTVTSSGTPT